MPDEMTVVLGGIGGYGACYLEEIFKNGPKLGVRLIAAVDPFAAQAKDFAELQKRNIPVYATLDDCLAKHSPTLVVLASPIHMHCPQTCLAVAKGAHVLCEKPVAATIQEVHRMIAARDASKRKVAIGYQYCYTQAIAALKRDIVAGVFGKPKRFKSMLMQGRDEVYYSRNTWAGRQKDAHGNWVLDSPVNNAFSHFLNLMLYLLGDRIDRSADLQSVEAELYRANPTIDNYDTAALRSRTRAGVEVNFYVSHALRRDASVGPFMHFEFEKATIGYAGDGWSDGSDVFATFADGSKKSYGDLHTDHLEKFSAMVDVIRRDDVVPCGLEAAGAHTLCMNGAQLSMPEIGVIPADQVAFVGEPGKRVREISNIRQIMTDCYETWKLPNEIGIAWAKKPQVVRVDSLRQFPV
jgi:predicted dehydrogenase